MPSFEVIAIGFAILVWIISSIVKGLRWLGTQLGGTSAPPLPPGPVQGAMPPASQTPLTSQTLPQRVPPLLRQPVRTEAGPAPVRYKTSAATFVSQEEALLAEGVSGLGVPLVSPTAPRAAQAAPLFGGTDDLVRAIILQEVLGPPLSRRAAAPPPMPPPA